MSRIGKMPIVLPQGTKLELVGGEVKVFAKEYLYQWYLDECGDSWGLCEVNPMIKREFEDEEK